MNTRRATESQPEAASSLGGRLLALRGVRFALLLLCAWLLIGSSVYLFAAGEFSHERDQLAAGEHEAVAVASYQIVQILEQAAEEVNYLPQTPRLRDAMSTPTAQNLALLSEVFLVYAQAHSGISVLRWIEQDGREVLRVDADGPGQAHIVNSTDRMRTADDYFHDTVSLPAGSLYISGWDLRRVNNQVAVPFTPVVRIGMPLVDAQGRRHGLILINYLGQSWLDAILLPQGQHGANLMLLNREGFWLHSPQPGDQWGFRLGNPAVTLAARDPEAWAHITAADQGTAYLPSGLWVWRNLRPLAQIPARFRPGNAEGVPLYGHDHIWRLVSHIPPAQLAAERARIWRGLANTLWPLFLLAIPLSLWLVTTQRRVARLNRALAERAIAAEAADLAKTSFLSNMSHEIRTPMNAVLGLAHLLERSELSADAHDLVRKIRIAGRSLQGIINDILDFARIEAGRLEIERAPFHLKDVLANIATVMEMSAGEKDIELIITPPASGVDHLVGDALRLEQVLINLIGNAIKFADSGHVELRVTVTEMNRQHVTVRFSVHDTGIGISVEQQRNLFLPFSQADISTTRRFGGSGLGLAICRQLVAAMHGQIGLISNPGVGSEFWFVLDFPRVADDSMSEPGVAALDVLIADDHPIAREALRNTAETLGWNATTVNSGQEAVEQALAAPGRFDVILLDWKMPDMDGLLVAHAIHRALDGLAPPILLMATAGSRRDLLADPAASLLDGLLSKPVTASSLYDAVVRAFRSRQGTLPTIHAPSTRRLERLRVLVVDDSDINREVAQRILASEGAHVTLANNGKRALEWLRAHPTDADLVLMDVQMPVMDGYEATRQLRATPGLASLPVVALTAGVFRAQEEAALAAGMNAYIAKPFDVDEAVALIRRLTGRGSAGASGASAPMASDDNLSGDLPGLAVQQGLAAWKEAPVYRRYLRRFAAEHADSAQRIAAAPLAEALAQAHRLKGIAANLALPQVALQAGQVHAALAGGMPAAASCAALQDALATALAAIARYTADPEAPDRPAAAPSDPARAAALLMALVPAFASNDPAEVEPLLAELASHVPPTCLIRLRQALDDFDFRDGAAAARALAAELGFSLEK